MIIKSNQVYYGAVKVDTDSTVLDGWVTSYDLISQKIGTIIRHVPHKLIDDITGEVSWLVETKEGNCKYYHQSRVNFLRYLAK